MKTKKGIEQKSAQKNNIKKQLKKQIVIFFKQFQFFDNYRLIILFHVIFPYKNYYDCDYAIDKIFFQYIDQQNFFKMTTKQKYEGHTSDTGSKRIQNYVFKYTDVLGKGSFSTVYKAINEEKKTTVAIKVVELASLKSEKLAELLNSQIKIIKKLNHRNVVRCYQVLTSLNNCYIITELCEGGDLETKLKKNGKCLEQKEIYSIVRDIYEGLYYLSKESIIHRDLKISNIFMKDGIAKIADFGFAKVSKQSFADASIGSPLYMSPQGFLMNTYGPKTDVWAFGILLYELTHGQTPFHSCKNEKDLGKLLKNQLKTGDLKSELSESLKNLIIRCLDCNQETRIEMEEIKDSPFIKKAYCLAESLKTYNQLNTGSRNHLMSLNNVQKEERSSSLFNNPVNNRLFSNNFHSPSNINSTAETSKKIELKKPIKVNNNQMSQNYNFITTNPSTISQNKFKDLIKSQDFSQKIVDNIQNDKHIHNYKPSTTNTKVSDLFPKNQESKISHLKKKLSDSFKLQPNFSCQLQLSKKKSQLNQNTPFTPIPFLHQENKHLEILEFKEKNDEKNISKPYFAEQYYRSLSPSPSPSSRRQSLIVNKYLQNVISFPKTLSFSEALGLLHYCRLCFKYIHALSAFSICCDEKYKLWIMTILQELMRKVQLKNIIFERGKASKQTKFKEILKQYIQKYSEELTNNKRSSLTICSNKITSSVMLELFKDDYTKIDENLPQKLSQKYLTAAYYGLILCQHTNKIKRCEELCDFSCFINGEMEEMLSGKLGPVTMETYLSTRRERTF